MQFANKKQERRLNQPPSLLFGLSLLGSGLASGFGFFGLFSLRRGSLSSLWRFFCGCPWSCLWRLFGFWLRSLGCSRGLHWCRSLSDGRTAHTSQLGHQTALTSGRVCFMYAAFARGVIKPTRGGSNCFACGTDVARCNCLTRFLDFRAGTADMQSVAETAPLVRTHLFLGRSGICQLQPPGIASSCKIRGDLTILTYSCRIL